MKSFILVSFAIALVAGSEALYDYDEKELNKNSRIERSIQAEGKLYRTEFDSNNEPNEVNDQGNNFKQNRRSFNRRRDSERYNPNSHRTVAQYGSERTKQRQSGRRNWNSS